MEDNKVTDISLIPWSKYQVTKLMGVLFAREIVVRLGEATRMIVNLFIHGLCCSRPRQWQTLCWWCAWCGGSEIAQRRSVAASLFFPLQPLPPLMASLKAVGRTTMLRALIYTEIEKRVQKNVIEQTLQVLGGEEAGDCV